jgi:hypothetical protein
MERDNLSSRWLAEREGRLGDGAWANAWFPSWESGDVRSMAGSMPLPMRRESSVESAALEVILPTAADCLSPQRRG